MLFFKEYLKRVYGKPFFRVPVDLPLSCPHRLRDGGRGCIFCPEDGARARHLKANMDINAQVSSGIDYLARRYKGDYGLIAYFQSFTGTNADPETLRELHREALACAEFDIVIISTRPDCLPGNILDYLEELSRQHELWIELGVQTANDGTLKAMNRAHDFACSALAVEKLAERGIKVAAHLILGLPGEGAADFVKTAKSIAPLPFSALKIHNLLVIKNTELAAKFADEGFKVMNEYEYAEALLEFLDHVPPEWPLMRVTADAVPDSLVAPKWRMKKGQFIELLKKMRKNGGITPVDTGDGTETFYNPVYRQHYNSLAGALSEARKIFVDPCIDEHLLQNRKTVNVLDIGLGLGYNALSALEKADAHGCGINIISLENDLKSIDLALRITQNPEHRKMLSGLRKNGGWQDGSNSWKILEGDARKTVSQTPDDCFDAVFLDPFSVDINPELWTLDFIRLIKSKIRDRGILATYSSSPSVRGALLKAGFHVGLSTRFGRKRPATAASLSAEKIDTPLPRKEKRIITQSSAGTPYRDPSLDSDAKDIIKRRRNTVTRLRSKGVPKWIRD